MKNPHRYTVTAALPYANGPLHIGHMAGVYIPADIFVRYLRLRNRQVLFVCGSDEHGAAITLRAKKEGISPKEIIDKYHNLNKKSFVEFGIGFDIFHRTSEAIHHETAGEFFQTLEKKGAFDVQSNQQFFDEKEQQFLADRYIIGTCPNCSFENAYGDQCEKCGSTLNPTDLINPRSALSGEPPVLKQTSHWYLPMQKHEKWVREWLMDGILNNEKLHDPKDWKKQVLGQCKSWLDAGLQPRAMTRDLDWGVKVPLENADGKVLYVWLDAPIGYISATKQWALDNNTDWKPWWQAKDTSLIHFLAKDNIVFHCIIFPIILQQHGEYILPVNVPANEFLNLEGNKISTSRNWAVWLNEYLEDFPGRQDELRYVLNAISPEFRDSEFTWNDFQARVNNELVAVLGNFINRAMVLNHKYYGGVVQPMENPGEQEEIILRAIAETPQKVAESIEKYHFREAQHEAMGLARLGNKYLAETEPWKLQKTDPQRTAAVLNISLQIAATLSVVIEPFLPNTAAKIKSMLNIGITPWEDAGIPILHAGHTLGEPELLFAKVEDEAIVSQLEKLKVQSKAGNTPPAVPEKPHIGFEDFMKLDIRVGEITAAERIPKTSKLLKINVKVGDEVRQVVSGIAEYYSPEEVIGKRVSILLNLQPRNIRGIESFGMILMAETPDGELNFVSPEKMIPSGSIIR